MFERYEGEMYGVYVVQIANPLWPEEDILPSIEQKNTKQNQ